MGRWSREIARDFLVWLDAGPHLRWLDVGCGTGALTGQILSQQDSAPSEVWGVDPSPAFVERAVSLGDSKSHFATGVADALPCEAGKFDVVASGLLLNFLPAPACAVREMIRVARPAGVVASYVWDYLGEMQMLRYFWDAVLARVPTAGEVDEVQRFAMCKPEPLKGLFSAEGLEDVEVTALDMQTHFRDFDDYWSPFLAGQGGAPAYLMSLPNRDRLAVEQSLRSKLPYNTGGCIKLLARAWAVRGRVPS